MNAAEFETELDTDLDDDVVWGAKAIGEVINQPPRKTSYLLEKGVLPAGKINNRWVSSKKRLRKQIAAVISGTA